MIKIRKIHFKPMSAQIFVRIVNFKCFQDFSLTLQEGINFIVADSGKGKTTINKAIYFTLYGGRKFKNIQNRDQKDKPTVVSIHYQSQLFEWRITRTRPSETVVVELRDANGVFTYKDAPAQDWINKQFGIENIWLSASYIGVTRPHFLVGGNSNADKLELLQRITYGDTASQNQPDTYLNEVKKAILYYNERFKQLNDNIRINEGVKQSYQTRNPALLTHPNITDEETWEIINKRDSEKIEMEKLRGIWSQLITKKQFTDYLNSLPEYKETIEDVDHQIKTMELQLKKLRLKSQLKDFDKKIYDVDINVLSSDHYLYGKYISEGFTPQLSDNYSLASFINEKKEIMKEYNKQLEIVSKNKEIEENNMKKKEVNNSLTLLYNNQLYEYQRRLNEIDVYNKQKNDIKTMKDNIAMIDMIKLPTCNSNEDDMSSRYAYSLIGTFTEKINYYKKLAEEGEKYNICVEKIKNKERLLIEPNRLQPFNTEKEDDLSLSYIDLVIQNLKLSIKTSKERIQLTEQFTALYDDIEIKKSKLPLLRKSESEDDLSSEYIQEYRRSKTLLLNDALKRKAELQERIKIKDEFDLLSQKLDSINCIKLPSISTNEDDMSLNYANEYRITLVMQMNELTCPCCSHGLLLTNGMLIPGTTINNSLESKKMRSDNIIIAKEEEIRRSERDNLSKIILESKRKLDNIKDGNLNDVEVNIDFLTVTLEDTKNEYEKRLLYFSLNKEIDGLLNRLNLMNKWSINDMVNEIEQCEKQLEKCGFEYKIRENIAILKSEIEYLKDDLTKLTQNDLPLCYEKINYYSSIIEIAKKELEKRTKYDDINRTILSFEKIETPNEPEIPNKPTLMILEDLITTKYIKKPSLEIFDIPFYEYTEYTRLWKSNEIKHLDLELKSIEVNDYHTDDQKLLESEICQKSSLLLQMKKTFEERKRYEAMISSLPEDDILIEKKCNDLYLSIGLLENKIALANEMKEIRRIESCITQMNNELNATVEYLGHFNYYYSMTEELGMSTLEKRIIDINEPLKEVLDSLFDEPISVKISPFKELKNGTTKLQVNLVVEHKNALVDDYDDECSTGQIGRISIALLLAFSRNNSNPFIILDEVLSSVETSRQNDILDILPQYASGKFIINICHGVAEGNAKNIIYIK